MQRFFETFYPTALLGLLTLLYFTLKVGGVPEDTVGMTIIVIPLALSALLAGIGGLRAQNELYVALYQTLAVVLALIATYILTRGSEVWHALPAVCCIVLCGLLAHRSTIIHSVEKTMVWQHIPYTAAAITSYLAYQGHGYGAYTALSLFIACHFAMGFDLKKRKEGEEVSI